MSHRSQFLPYKVCDSRLSLDKVLENNSKAIVKYGQKYDDQNSIGYYSDLLQCILDLGFCDIRPMCRLMDPMDKETVVIGLRHDVDHDIVTARAMCHVEHNLELSGSYYLLHSHPFVSPYYYAYFDDKTQTLLRNNCLASLYQEMQDKGSEIGLHVDAVRLYRHGIDGQEAIVEELNWLRSNGIDIKGIAAHGSAPAYGIENFEFFQEFHLGYRSEIVISNHRIPLGTLSAADHGISYEANFARVPQYKPSILEIDDWIQSAEALDKKNFLNLYLYRNIYMTYDFDAVCWLYDKDCWAISTNGYFVPDGRSYDVIELCKNLTGKRIVFHIHPIYCGLRK